jgi:polyisoprenoid-binding protein YceI
VGNPALLRRKVAIIIGILCVLPLCAQESAIDLDAAKTEVAFTLGDVLHTVHGKFKLKRGSLHFDPTTGKISGQVVVDATSGESGSDARDSRMHKNILESAKYPEISFAPDRVDGKVAVQGASQVQVHGTFRIHGADHEITVPADVQMGSSDFSATLHFLVPYVQWGMKNPSTFILKVNDKVEIDIKAVGRIVAAH